MGGGGGVRTWRSGTKELMFELYAMQEDTRGRVSNLRNIKLKLGESRSPLLGVCILRTTTY